VRFLLFDRIMYCLSYVRAWNVVSTNPPEEVHQLFKRSASTFCSFFDSHRYIATDHGLFPIPPQYRPPCAADNLVPPSPETLFRLREDGWIWLVGGGKDDQRVCWLPPAYRPIMPTLNKNFVTLRDSVRLVTDSGRLVVLDLKEWFKYAKIHSQIHL
jgi:hypothetical protein